MARSDIRAGKAYVELTVKNSQFMRAMDNAKKRLNAIGASMVSFGSKVAGIGAGIVGSMAAAGKVFADVGDKLDKMSIRTGVAAESLSALGFAAQQSGATIDDVGGVLQRMNRRFGRIAADAGTATQTDALDKLGLSVKELESMSPEQRFMAMADAIAGYGDQAQAAGLAQRVLGTGVDQLLPLFAGGSEGIRELMQEAKDLGVVMSNEDAKAAAALTDAMGRVKSTMSAVAQQIGAAVAPAMEDLANRIAKAVSVAIKFVKENRNLVVLAAKAGLVIAGFGTAIVAVGTAFMFAAGTIGSVMTVAASLVGIFSGMVTVIGAVLSPMGLLIAALIAGGIWFFRFSETGQQAIATLREKATAILGSLRETFTTAFGGIRDAIASGDFALAGQIAMTALRLVMTQGLDQLSQMVGGKFGDMIGKVGSQIIGGDFAGAWNTVVLGMSEVWTSFTGGIVNAFANAAGAVIDVWKKTIDEITNMILSKAAEGGAFGKFFEKISGVNVAEEMEREQRLQKQAESMGLGSKSDSLFDDIRQGTYSDPGTDAAVQDLESRLDALRQSAEDDEAAASDALAENTGGAADGVSSDVARLKGELEALRAKAKQSRAESKERAETEEAEKEESGGRGMSGAGGKASVATFSAAAAVAMNQGGARDPVVRKQEETNGLLKKGNEIMQGLAGGIENLGLHHA